MILAITLLVLLLIDLYVFKGISILLSKFGKRKLKLALYLAHWLISSLLFAFILFAFFYHSSIRNAELISWYMTFFGVMLIIYIPKLIFVVFHLFEDILLGIKWIIFKISFTRKKNTEGSAITRSKFLSQTGIVLASIPFASLIYGMAKGRFDFRVEQIDLRLPNLPKSFDGLTIVQISDIHIGSFSGYQDHVKEAIQLINKQNADLLFFTGDLVNNFAEELDGWKEIFSTMKARIGKYSILGNHDYGNYYHWDSEEEKHQNFLKFKLSHHEIGFKLLCNSGITLSSKNEEKLAIIGVENWGKPPFPQYGNYDLAVKGFEDIPCKILLSHDPMHWDAKILRQTDVALTLSGHTHGMQMGVTIAGKEYSPAKLRFPRWAGLYKENNQFLYVNRGLGYIGYPGRVGMRPEVTVIKLKC